MANNVNGQQHDRSALIVYGSETGNSQEVAEELGRVAERLHFMTRVTEMDSIDLNLLLRFTIVIFVVSTTGQGEFPKNAQKFWKSLLRKRLPPDCLSHVSYTTFGLGDSSYAQFNYAARKLHKRLEQLGAQEIYPRGEADDRHEEGIDGTFLSWAADFNKHLLSTFPLPEGVKPIPPEVLLPPKILLTLREESSIPNPSALPESINSHISSKHESQPTSAQEPLRYPPIGLPSSNPKRILQDQAMLYEPEEEGKAVEGPACPMLKEEYNGECEAVDFELPSTDMLPLPNGVRVKLMQNDRITPTTHWQDVRLLLFQMEEGFDYYVGDTITIFPKNFPEDVQAVINLMGWNEVADKPVVLNNNSNPDYGAEMALNGVSGEPYVLRNSSLRDLLTHNLDITAIPKRKFFNLGANNTEDEVHKARLFEFASVAYTDEYYDYATRPRRSILEVLHDFPSVRFPFQWVFAVFPLIRGRQYSICSSSRRESGNGKNSELEIIVALVKYKTVLKKVRQGLCSRYLDTLQPGTWLNTNLSTTNISSPWHLNTEYAEHLVYPTICVAPGTGIAPVRALIWHRALIDLNRRNRTSELIDKPVGKTYLFFGGRNKTKDFFFKNEFMRSSTLTQLFAAFSRDQEKKIYVQDIIKERGQLVADLILKQNARIFVCGSSGNMPKAVRAAFVDVIAEWDTDNRGRGFAEALVKDLEKFGRYMQETW